MHVLSNQSLAVLRSQFSEMKSFDVVLLLCYYKLKLTYQLPTNSTELLK